MQERQWRQSPSKEQLESYLFIAVNELIEIYIFVSVLAEVSKKPQSDPNQKIVEPHVSGEISKSLLIQL